MWKKMWFLKHQDMSKLIAKNKSKKLGLFKFRKSTTDVSIDADFLSFKVPLSWIEFTLEEQTLRLFIVKNGCKLVRVQKGRENKISLVLSQINK